MALTRRAIFNPDLVRTDPDPKRHDESTFDFYNRCSEPVMSGVRARLEEWFAEYPSGDARQDLLGKFRDGDDRQWYSADWELYVYASLRRQGFEVAPNPRLPHTSRRLDFLATKGGDRVYIECAVVTHSDEKAAEKRGVGALEAAIDASGIQDYWLDLDFDVRGSGAISPGPFVAGLKNWIAGLDIDEMQGLVTQGRDALPSYDWSEGGWIARVWAIPRSPELRNRSDIRPLGIFPGEFDIGKLWLALRGKLETKADAYGELDAPYLIAVSAPEGWPGSDHPLWAAYGHDPFTAAWRREGFFLRPDSPEHRGVSGVVMSTALQVHSHARLAPTLYENPHAGRMAPASLGWRRVRPAATRLLVVPGRDPAELFGVGTTWPGVPWATEDAG